MCYEGFRAITGLNAIFLFLILFLFFLFLNDVEWFILGRGKVRPDVDLSGFRFGLQGGLRVKVVLRD